jgi:uncharacterized spore protein YtfJ
MAANERSEAMDIQESISKMQDAVTVKRVYGEPYERDGIVVIPAAAVGGGFGGGGGEDKDGGKGSGGGGGLGARPVGAYVIEGGDVRWEAALDVSRIAGQALMAAVGIALLLRRALR